MSTSTLTSPIKPFEVRDFSRGRVARYSANTYLAPKNSVANSLNVNFDTIIGSAVVRPGTTILGAAAVSAGNAPTGLFLGSLASGTYTQYVVFSTNLYYFRSDSSTSWQTSDLSVSAGFKGRFAQLGGSVFFANGNDSMASTTNSANWLTGTSNNCIATDSVKPSLLFSTQGVMLASGYSAFPSRVYLSSVINVNNSPFITWATSPAGGFTGLPGWIDINPGNGEIVTGFAETSAQILVFTNLGMYRLSVANLTVDPDRIVNYGAVSQEAITTCQGIVYFYTGLDIRTTTGDYPEQISRLGCQDFLDAIPLANQKNVSMGNDGLNVYLSIGNVTLQPGTNKERAYTNVVLKYSTRDQSFSVHSYFSQPKMFSQYLDVLKGTPLKSTFADPDGYVQTLNWGCTDRQSYGGTVGNTINFELESQEIDLDNRAHTDSISNKMAIFTNFGIDSSFQVRDISNDYTDVMQGLEDRVNVADDIEFEGNCLIFRWFGEITPGNTIYTMGTYPIFEGIYIEDVTDLGLIEQDV